MKCHECKQKMVLKQSILQDAPYEFYQCPQCKEEILDSIQLQKFAAAHKAMRRAKEVKLAKWGNSIGVRIPKQYIDELGLVDGQAVSILKDEKGLRIIPE